MTIWRAIATFFGYWNLRLRNYKHWSQLYRFLYERRFRDVEIRTFASLALLPPFMRSGALWVSDNWVQLWDAVSSPQYVQRVFEGAEPPPKHGFDCDEHAIYLVAAIQKSMAAGTLIEKVLSARFFTVTWFDGGKIQGHNTCLLEWGPSSFSFMDYGLPSIPCRDIQGVADQIRAKYGAGEVHPMVWCVQALDLTPETIHWG